MPTVSFSSLFCDLGSRWESLKVLPASLFCKYVRVPQQSSQCGNFGLFGHTENEYRKKNMRPMVGV